MVSRGLAGAAAPRLVTTAPSQVPAPASPQRTPAPAASPQRAPPAAALSKAVLGKGAPPVLICCALPPAGVVFVPDRDVRRRIRWHLGPVTGPPIPLDGAAAAAELDDDDNLHGLRVGGKRVRTGLTVDGGDDSEGDGPSPAKVGATPTSDGLLARRRRRRLAEVLASDDGDAGDKDAARGGDDLPFMGTVLPAAPAAPLPPPGPSSVGDGAAHLDDLCPRRHQPRRREPDALDAAPGADAGADADGELDIAAAADLPLLPAGFRGAALDDGAGSDGSDMDEAQARREAESDDDGGGGSDDDDDEFSDADHGAGLGSLLDPAEAYFTRGRRSRDAAAAARGRGRAGRGGGRTKAAGASRAGKATSERTMARLPPVADEVLRATLATLPDPWKAARASLAELHASQFRQWCFELSQGFNLLFYGFGSKKPLLMSFVGRALTDAPVVVVNGYHPSTNIRTVLAMISRDVLHDKAAFRSVNDQAAAIARQFGADAGRKLYLLVLSIDGPAMRNAKTQGVLSVLAAAPHIHLIASSDHLNCALLWNSTLAARFNWIWHDGTTFAPFVHETANESTLLGEAGQPTVRSVGQVLRSLTANARGIFAVLARHQLEQAGDSGPAPDDAADGGGQDGGDGARAGLTFAAYYAKCLDLFLVSNDVALRSQLTEFRDHRIIQTARGDDGSEYMYIPLSREALATILEQMEG